MRGRRLNFTLQIYPLYDIMKTMEQKKKEKAEKEPFLSRIKRWLRIIADGVFCEKYTCMACESELPEPNAKGLCEKCLGELIFNDESVCEKCGVPLLDESSYCANCTNAGKRNFDKGVSVFVYAGLIKQLLRRYKFNNKKYFDKYFAQFLFDKTLEEFVGFDVITYIPMTEKKMGDRGYNQSERMARVLGEKLNTPVKELLVKTRETKAQHNLKYKERCQNLKNAFAFEGEYLTNQSVLLIDDVLTTGATADEAALILKKNGAGKVYVLTLCGALKANSEYALREYFKRHSEKITRRNRL